MDFEKKLKMFGLDKKSSNNKMAISSQDKAGMLGFSFNSKGNGFNVDSFLGSNQKSPSKDKPLNVGAFIGSNIKPNFNNPSNIMNNAFKLKPGMIASNRLAQQNKINSMYPSTQAGMFSDFDKDGVPNILDCDPLDKFKQDEGVKQLLGDNPTDPATGDVLTGLPPGSPGLENIAMRQELLMKAKEREQRAPSQASAMYSQVRSIQPNNTPTPTEEVQELISTNPNNDILSPLEKKQQRLESLKIQQQMGDIKAESRMREMEFEAARKQKEFDLLERSQKLRSAQDSLDLKSWEQENAIYETQKEQAKKDSLRGQAGQAVRDTVGVLTQTAGMLSKAVDEKKLMSQPNVNFDAGKLSSTGYGVYTATQGVATGAGAQMFMPPQSSGVGFYRALGSPIPQDNIPVQGSAPTPIQQTPFPVQQQQRFAVAPPSYSPGYPVPPSQGSGPSQGPVLPADATRGQFDGQKRADGLTWSAKSEKWVKYTRKKYDKSKSQAAPAYYPPQPGYYPQY